MSGPEKANALRPRWSKVFSDLWENKSRTMLVVASIAAGVFAIGALVSAYFILAEDIPGSYSDINATNITISTAPFQENLTRVVEQVEGVEQAEGRLISNVRVRRPGELWQFLTLYVAEDYSEDQINQVLAIEGQAQPPHGELVLSQDFLRNAGFQVGELVEVEFPDGSTHLLPVAGLVTDMAQSGPAQQTDANLFITTSTYRMLGFTPYFNRLLITIEGDGGDIQQIKAVAEAVEDKLERNGAPAYRTQTDLSTEHPMQEITFAVLGILSALAVLLTLLSSSLIFNTLNALLAQQTRQIGVIKLVGGQRRQILGMYILLIIAYSLVTLAITMPLGAIAGFAFADFMATLLGASLSGFRIVPLAFVLQVIVAIVVPLGAGYFPVDQGAKTDVRTALSNEAQEKESGQGDLLNRLTARLRFISRPILLSVRNTFRKRGRLLLTIFTLTVAGSVFIAVFNVRSSMLGVIDDVMKLFLSDVTIYFEESYPVSRIEQELLPIPGVEKVEGWDGTDGAIWDEDDNVVVNLSIVASPHDSELLDPDIVAGRWLQPGEKYALVISDSIYDWYPELEVGDSLAIKLPGEAKKDWEVVGIFRFISMMGDPIAYADFDFVADLNGTPNQAYSYRIVTSEHSLEYQQSINRYITGLLEDKGLPVYTIESGEEIRASNTDAINILVIVLLIMALLTAFVGAIGLTGTMGMNVLERTREIGVMRAIGAVDFAIMQSVVIEALVIGLITWVLSIGGSYPISVFLLEVVGNAIMGTSPTLIFTPMGVFIWLGVVVFLSFVASLLPARNAARLTINEVLSYE